MEAPTLFIVDDDPLIAQLLALAGAQVGFEPRVVRDPNGLLGEVQGHGPCGVVLDIVMPDMDGLELLRMLGTAHFRGPVLILSGSDAMFLEAAARLAGRLGLNFMGAMTKPIDLPALCEKLERMKAACAPGAE